MPNPFFQIKLTFNTREKCPWFLEFHRHDQPSLLMLITTIIIFHHSQPASQPAMMTITFGRLTEKWKRVASSKVLAPKWFNLNLIRSHSIAQHKSTLIYREPGHSYYYRWMGKRKFGSDLSRTDGGTRFFQGPTISIWPLSIALWMGYCCVSSGV